MWEEHRVAGDLGPSHLAPRDRCLLTPCGQRPAVSHSRKELCPPEPLVPPGKPGAQGPAWFPFHVGPLLAEVRAWGQMQGA